MNLTGADTVIHFDPWWNPAVEDQATDRAYRIGQKKKVQVIKYVMKDSIEEKIYELQKRKKQLSDQLIQAGESFVTQLTMEEIKELFLYKIFLAIYCRVWYSVEVVSRDIPLLRLQKAQKY